MSATPFTDWFESHLSAPLGKQMSQTYWDMAPGETTFGMAWDKEASAKAPSYVLTEEAKATRERLIKLADRYVSLNELRPPKFYSEVIIPLGTRVADTVAEAILPKDMKMGGLDHGHFVMSVLSSIVKHLQYIGAGVDIAARAWSLMLQQMVGYYEQPNSWLSLKSKDYSAYGKCRIAAQCLRSLCDINEAAPVPGNAYSNQAYALVQQHLYNIALSNMADGPQGDGLRIPHWRVFQVGILMAALERVKLVFGIDTSPLLDRFRPQVAACVDRNTSGKPTGAFFYDVPADLSIPQATWTSLEGFKVGTGNGVEAWIYRYLPADAQEVMRTANTKLDVAVKAKFGIA